MHIYSHALALASSYLKVVGGCVGVGRIGKEKEAADQLEEEQVERRGLAACRDRENLLVASLL
jgi:hypothetical protein